jgi:putative transcriptional regulator
MRQNLKLARLEKKLSVADVSTLLGVSKSFYYKIEQGIRNPTMNSAHTLSIILGQNVEYLFFDNVLDKTSK